MNLRPKGAAMRKNRDLTENVRLLDNRLLAEMLCVSQSQLFALRQAGRVPLKPIRLGGSAAMTGGRPSNGLRRAARWTGGRDDEQTTDPTGQPDADTAALRPCRPGRAAGHTPRLAVRSGHTAATGGRG